MATESSFTYSSTHSSKSSSRGRELRSALGTLWTASPPLVTVAVASLGLLAASLLLQGLDDRQVLGVSTWVKPAKFAASVALAAITLAWMLGKLNPSERGLRRAAMTMAVTGALELVIITIQAARGVPSHFSARTPLDTIAFAVMGGGITIFWAAQGFVLVRALRHRFADAAIGWGIRLGLACALGGGAIAFLMPRPTPAQLTTLQAGQPTPMIGAHSVGVPDGGPGLPVTGWSTGGGDLRVPHFLGLHGLQVLPLAGVLFARRRRRGHGPESSDAITASRAMVFAIAVGTSYIGLTAVTLVQALRAQPLLSPDGLTLALGALAVVSGIATAAGGVLRTRARSFTAAPRFGFRGASI